MVRRRLLLGLALSFVVAAAVLGARAARGRVRAAPTAPDELRGVWHVHTTRSDGRGALAEVVRAAKDAGDAFVVVTDHDVVVPADQGWRDGVLVVQGLEVSTSLGHVVALGLERTLDEAERSRAPLRAIAARGGRAVLAHPLHPRRPFTGGSADGPWRGYEVFSNDTAWHQALHDRALARIARFALELPFDRGRAVLDLAAPPLRELARLDEQVLAARRAPGRDASAPGFAPPVVLLCSADAHGYPSYRAGFEAVSMHVPVRPTGDGARDAAAVADALLDGSATCVLEARGSVRRVRFHGGPAARLDLELPEAAPDATVRLVRADGGGQPVTERPLALAAGANAVPLAPLCGGTCSPGDYRLELWRGGAPWIFTNPAAIE